MELLKIKQALESTIKNIIQHVMIKILKLLKHSILKNKKVELVFAQPKISLLLELLIRIKKCKMVSHKIQENLTKESKL